MGHSHGNNEMNNKKIIKLQYPIILKYVWMVIILAACGKHSSLPVDLIGFEVPENEINHRMHLYAPKEINTFKTNESIRIAAEGTSEDQIAFNYSDVKMFIGQDDQWKEVDNFAKQHPDLTVLSPYKGSVFNTELIVLSPILPDPSQPVKLRIVIIGHVMSKGIITDEVTADYIDVELKP
jgi:hypothetical protein